MNKYFDDIKSQLRDQKGIGAGDGTSWFYPHPINKKTLELGFGAGELIRKLITLKNEVHGIDIGLLRITDAERDGTDKKAKLNYLDVSNDKFPYPDNYFDCVYCLTGETKLAGTPKTIAELIENDKVLGRNGQYQKVLKKFCREYTGELFDITPFGIEKFSITPNHRVLVTNFTRVHRSINKNGNKSVYSYNKTIPYWKEAKDLTSKDFMLFPRNKLNIPHYMPIRVGIKFKNGTTDKRLYNNIEIDYELMQFFGMFLSDGSYRRNKNGKICGVVLTVNEDKKDIFGKLKDIFLDKYKIKIGISKKSYGRIIRVYISNSDFCSFVHNNFGEYSHTKYISENIKNCHKDILVGLIHGYILCDGNLNKHFIRGSTASRQLRFDILDVMSKLGIACSLFQYMSTGIFKERLVKKSTQYQFGFSRHEFSKLPLKNILGHRKENFVFNINRHSLVWKVDEDYLYLPIRKICKKEVSNEYVYNIHTEDNTYGIQAIVHNCLEMIEHTENPSHIFHEVKRVLKPDGDFIIAYPRPEDNLQYQSGGHAHVYPGFLMKHSFRMFCDQNYFKLIKYAENGSTAWNWLSNVKTGDEIGIHELIQGNYDKETLYGHLHGKDTWDEKNDPEYILKSFQAIDLTKGIKVI